MIRLKQLPAGFALPPQKPRTASKPRQRAKAPGKAPEPSERDFQRQVIQLARLLNYRVAHFRTSMNARGKYQTAVAGDGAGFPDLVLVKPGAGVVFAELKVGKNRMSLAQEEWLLCLRKSGVKAYCWFPCDWHVLKRILEHGQ